MNVRINAVSTKDFFIQYKKFVDLFHKQEWCCVFIRKVRMLMEVVPFIERLYI